MFDEDADWVPTRGRAFVMKGSAEEASEPDRQDDPKPIKQEDPKPIRQEDPKPKVAQSEDSRDLTGQIKEVYTDAEGLDKASTRRYFSEQQYVEHSREPYRERLVRRLYQNTSMEIRPTRL